MRYTARMPRPDGPCPDTCNVLLVGGGGREHALAWAMKQSPNLGRLWLTHASNAGLNALGEACPHAWDTTNIFQLQRWCERESIDLVVVGPEGPLSEGIVDALEEIGCAAFGPSQAAAQLEADKCFAKEIMRQAAVPTADTRTFSDANSARRFALRGIDEELVSTGLEDEATALRRFLASNDDRGAVHFPELSGKIRNLLQAHDERCVVKAAGLAAGKGVIIAETLEEADAAVLCVSLADKRHNARCIVKDVQAAKDAGDEEFWDRFNAGPADQSRYYTALAEVLCRRRPGAAADELESTVRQLELLTGP